MTKVAMLLSLVPVSRQKTTAIRCMLAAVLFIAFFLFHTTGVSSDAARITGWTSPTTDIAGAVPAAETNDVPATVPASETKPMTDSESHSSDADESAANTKSKEEEKTASEDAEGEPMEEGKARPSKLSDAVMELLERYRPSQTVPDWKGRFDSQLWHWGELDANATNKLTLNSTELATIKKAHEGFVKAVHTRLPEYIPHRYGSSLTWTDRNKDVSETPKRGIVMVGGGKFNIILSVSLRFLRRAGTTLPVEVFLTEREYEKDVCENLFPSLNAQCRVYPTMHKSVSEGFQLKSFALLFSSFDEILFLDADNTAMRDVAPLFASAPFHETGLVTWPDFWQSTVSPLYYEISGTKPVAVSERPSSETGQLMIDKARHWKTLLLIVYYNFYGADFYYRLLNQGFTGMGDKETVLPAAVVFGLPAYQVHMPIEKVGHRFEDESIGGRVMVQYDPGEDWLLTKALANGEEVTDSQGKAVATPTTEPMWKQLYHQRVKPVFLHMNWPKWDPANLLGHISKWSDMTIGVDGHPEPAFSYPEDLAFEIRGTERMLWEEAMWLACNMRTRFRHWRNNGKAVHTCDNMKRHFERVFDTDVGRELGLGPDAALFPKLPDEMVGDE